MNKGIVLGCYEVPGYGGANTVGYRVLDMMQERGLEASYINLVDEYDLEYFEYVFGPNYGNPKGLPRVYNCVMRAPLFGPQPELKALLKSLDSGILVGHGFIAAYALKKAAPRSRVIFRTTGSQQAKEFIASGKDAMALEEFIRRAQGPPPCYHRREKQAVELADYVITHSEMIKSFFNYFFPSQRGKFSPEVIWFAEFIYRDAAAYGRYQKPFSERDIDLIFIASDWSRKEKNFPLLEKIVSGLPGANVHIVGEVPGKKLRATYHGLLTRAEEVFSLLGRSKTLVCPSRFDAAPGVLFEASALGCNVVASKNCGNWQLCAEDLLVQPYTAGAFLDRVRHSLKNKIEDRRDYFFREDSYQNLVDSISAFE